MKKERLKALMEDSLDHAKEILLKEGRLVPVAFLHYGNNVDIIGLLFEDSTERNMQFSLLRKSAKEKNAEAIFTIIESWYVTVDKKDMADKKHLQVERSKHPMRKECIFIYGECEEGGTTMVQIFDREGEKIVFGEKVDLKETVSLKFDFGIKNKNKQDKNLRDLS